MDDSTLKFNSIWGNNNSSTTTPTQTSAINSSPDLTSKFDNIWGTKTPPQGAPATSRADEIRNLGQTVQTQKSSSPFSNFLQGAGELITGGKAGQDFAQAGYTGFQAVKGALGGGNTIDDTQKQYIENGNTLLQLANKQTDPSLKLKYSRMAADNFTESANVPESIIGKVRSGEQITGDMLGLLTNLASAGGAFKGLGKVSMPISNPFVKGGLEGVIHGATQGSILFGGGGLSRGLQEEGNFQQVAQSTAGGTILGAGTGAVVEGVLGVLPPAISEGKKFLFGKKILVDTQLGADNVGEFSKDPSKFTLYRGESGDNPGFNFTTDKNFAATNGKVGEAVSLPSDAKVISVDTPGLGADLGAKDAKEVGDFYQQYFDEGYDAVVHPDPGMPDIMQVTINPEKINGLQAAPIIREPSGLSQLWSGKSEEQILSTPANEVYKLKPEQQSIWFDNKQAELDATSSSRIDRINAQTEIDRANIEVNHGVAKQQILEEAQKQADMATQKGEKLVSKLGSASNENVVAQRPAFIKLLQKQGNTYLDLVEGAMDEAGGESAPLQTQLSDYITANSNTPEEAANSLARLGGEQPESVGDVYDQIKSLRQELSTAGTKGTRVFTAADMAKQDDIKLLTGYLQDNGVDFSEANKMWAKWAPVRDQLVSEGQIFNQAGTKSETLASTMVKVAQGKDPGSVNFIKTLENQMGPINDENRAIIAELDATQKEALANSDFAKQLQTENDAIAKEGIASLKNRTNIAQEGIMSEASSAKDSLNSQRIEALRQANSLRNTLLKKILKGIALGASGVEAARVAILHHL